MVNNKQIVVDAKYKTQRFKAQKFGAIDSDMIIDFQQKTVTFPNQQTIFDDKFVGYTLMFFVVYEFFYFFFYGVSDIMLSVLSPLIALSLASCTILIIYISQLPSLNRLSENLTRKIFKREPNPRRIYEIKNPSYFKASIYGGFEITLEGKCKDHCDKAIFRRQIKGRNNKPTLEVTFLKQTKGLLTVKEYAI